MLLKSRCQERECRWYLGVAQPDGTEATEVHVCTAFPDGIPDTVAFGTNGHATVIKGQVGRYVYEKKGKED